ncbi:hypothetical protein [Halorubrum sp. AJ67]|uniref:hypothetical protein n=1 Tax=Halorubrum sp. AJ67 TaxID=1173487 RepID=UPI0003DB7375|nr:hypothetical protein [Halorubrum sp. AJ67]CDK39420.1 uncharacterized protein BN903_195 [Halorubrum sp. AJ67]
MNPTRRRYLRGVGGIGGAACLAGCASDGPGDDGGDGDGESDDSGGDAGGTRPEGTGGPGVSIVSTDGDVGLPVDLGVEVVREAATADHPPRLRTTLTNASDRRVRVGEGRAVHFEYVSDGSGALTFLPVDMEAPAEPDCWRLTDSIAVTEEYRTFELGAGESRSRSIDLYATPTDTDACLPVGEYRFETTVSIVSDDAEPQSSAEWGFSVVLE